MPFAGLELSRRLEAAEGRACLRFAQARSRLFPASGAAWMEHAGACAVFDGIDSPVTQTFGLGLFEPLTPASLDTIERFFFERRAPVMHELSPHAGVAAMDLLCTRGYRPHETANVLFQPVSTLPPSESGPLRVRIAGAQDAAVWTETSTRGWVREHPELREFLLETGAISFARDSALCFLAEYDGQPGAAGALCLHQGVALFAGSATVPELRRRGLQGALLDARLRAALERGCDLAMMVAEPGSESQRNAERKGFRIAYTRTKWRLEPPAP